MDNRTGGNRLLRPHEIRSCIGVFLLSRSRLLTRRPPRLNRHLSVPINLPFLRAPSSNLPSRLSNRLIPRCHRPVETSQQTVRLQSPNRTPWGYFTVSLFVATAIWFEIFRELRLAVFLRKDWGSVPEGKVAPCRNRTCNPVIKSHLLCQLS